MIEKNMMQENSLNQATAELILELIECQLERLADESTLWERLRGDYHKQRARLMEARQTLASMVDFAQAERP